MEVHNLMPDQGKLSSFKSDLNKNQTNKSPFPIRNNSKVQPINTSQGVTRKKSSTVPTIRIAPRKTVRFKDRLLDAIYFICPDCSYVQCCTILLGILMGAAFTAILLYAGGYWKREEERQPKIVV